MRRAAALSVLAIGLAGNALNPGRTAAAGPAKVAGPVAATVRRAATATPIQHLVVIFQENESFDHYFGTYPNAANPSEEPQFNPLPNTPTVDGYNSALLTNNPNFLNQNNGAGAANPFRLDRLQILLTDQDNGYTAEQMGYDAGLVDLVPLSMGVAGPPPDPPPATVGTTGLAMGYYDGNTVTALWNYAQHFAMSDNSHGTVFGATLLGHLNLISGQTNGVLQNLNGTGSLTDGGDGSSTVIANADPIGDVCGTTTKEELTMAGPNIGNSLTNAGVTWGWFVGGFNLTIVNPNGTTGCNRSTTSRFTGVTESDYGIHYDPFQFYPSTANPTHARPTSVFTIGHAGDPANNQYDVQDFFSAVRAGNFPSVSFLKAPTIQTGHPGTSSALDEQVFIVNTLNFLQQQPDWSSTAVIIAWDDSDGWYDHQLGPIVNQSNGTADALTGPDACGNGNNSLPGVDPANLHALGRCGYGPRLPLLVISPYARPNFVDHSLTDQTSILRFIEDNWLGGQRLGAGSFDAIAGSLENMLNFIQTPNPTLLLNP